MVASSDAAATFELRAVTGDNGDTTQRIVEALNQRFPGLQSNADVRALTARNGAAVYLALGPAALKATIDTELNAPLLSLFTSGEGYARLLGPARTERKRLAVTAIYAEASPANQMQLIRALYRRRVTVAVLVTDNTLYLEPMIHQAARAAGLDVDVQNVNAGENVIRILNRLKASSVLLTVPDPALYTPDTIRNVLESTYRRNQAVIGFSAALVRAGTLAAAYSTIEDTLAQVGDVVELLAAGRVPPPQYPLYWRVAFNENVARSLNIVIDPSIRGLGNPAP